MALDSAAVIMKFYTILYYSDNSLSIKDRKAGKRGEKRKGSEGASLVVHWLRLCAPIAGGSGLIPGQGTRIPHATGCREKKKKKARKEEEAGGGKGGNGRRGEEEEDKEKESLLIINPIKWHPGYNGEERKIPSTLPNYP